MADPDGTCAKVPWSSGDPLIVMPRKIPNEQLKIHRDIETFTHEVKDIFLKKTHTLRCIAFLYYTLCSLTLHYMRTNLTLPYDTLPYLPIPYQSLPYLTIPYQTLPDLTRPYRTLPDLTVPYLTVPYHTYTHTDTYTHTHIHSYMHACMHTYGHTDRQS